MAKKVRGKPGWYGHRYEHSLAARGVKMKMKQQLVDPVFFAQKNEQMVPMSMIRSMVREGLTLSGMMRRVSSADKEDVRQRGIKAIEMRDADDTLSRIDTSGVDSLVVEAKQNPMFQRRVERVLSDSQKSSFLQDEKKRLLQLRLQEI